jgi:hypothetical protein
MPPKKDKATKLPADRTKASKAAAFVATKIAA